MAKPTAEVVFAMRMFMTKYHLTPADILKIMVSMESTPESTPQNTQGTE